MSKQFDQRLARLREAEPMARAIATINRGVEREALRVNEQGRLAETPHPPGLGSKLTHPYITTDFSEAQPELITPVAATIDETLGFLGDVHRFVHRELGDEILWSASMPCVLAGDEQIPIAQYGTSNLGRLKTTYRNGLGHRYGRLMQTICAVHYNFSLAPEFWGHHQDAEGDRQPPGVFRSARYFDLIRNFRRLSWLPIYLFGASPAVCESFVRGRSHHLTRFDDHSLFAPYATSLRNGDLGYQSALQSDSVHVSYNDLASYVGGLAHAITTPYTRYSALGVTRAGDHLQVSDAYLQSEAEFYTTVRAKCVPPSGVNFLSVLAERGVEYLEVRLLDVNPYLPLGIDEEEILFLDLFLIYCLLEASPPIDAEESRDIVDNVLQTVYRGRDPALTLRRGDESLPMLAWGKELFTRLEEVASLLDEQAGEPAHARALEAQMRKLEDPDLTISARILAEMRSGKLPFYQFAMNHALEHQRNFRASPIEPAMLARLEAATAQSQDAQEAIEAADVIGFEEYLEHFLDGYREVAARFPDPAMASTVE